MKRKNKLNIMLALTLLALSTITVSAAYTSSFVDNGQFHWVRGTGPPSSGYFNLRSNLSGYGKYKQTKIVIKNNVTGNSQTHPSKVAHPTTLDIQLNVSEYAGYDPGQRSYSFGWNTSINP